MTKGHTQALPGAVRPEVRRQPASGSRVKAMGTVHRMLRTGTRNDHALIDGMLLPLDLAKARDYELFLSIHAESLQALAGFWRDEDGTDFQAMLGLLRSDLATLGSPTSARCIHACIPASRGAGLGVAYVIRGSRLGAAFLRRGVPASMPTSYLDFAPTLPWNDFLGQLEILAGDPTATQAAMLAARNTFAVFLCVSSRRQDLRGAPS
jgi:heme oxygenase (biliverdin-IX-beta and delta-forming)